MRTEGEGKMIENTLTSIPAFCDSCGTAFPSGFGAGDNTTFWLKDCKSGPCPNCGGEGSMLDGRYKLDAGVIKILGAPESTREKLLELKQLLLDARAARATPAQVGSILDESAPEFSGLA
ncbi:hypothetical protein G6F65_018990 [Rhizopus arrhizus]|nr:hypothetical protein G6F65_018990 [Rhizopus arrhizus]